MKFNTPPKDGAKPPVSTTLPGKSGDATSNSPQHRGSSLFRSENLHAAEKPQLSNSPLPDPDRMLRLAGAMQSAGLDSGQYVLLKMFLPELHGVLALVKSDKAELIAYNSLLDHVGIQVGFARRLQEHQRLSNLKPDEKKDLKAVLSEIHAAVQKFEERLQKVTMQTGFGPIPYGQSSYDGIIHAASIAHEKGKISLITRNTIIQTCSLFSDLKSLEPFFLKE